MFALLHFHSVTRETIATSSSWGLSLDATDASGNTYTFMLSDEEKQLSLWPPPQDCYDNIGQATGGLGRRDGKPLGLLSRLCFAIVEASFCNC